MDENIKTGEKKDAHEDFYCPDGTVYVFNRRRRIYQPDHRRSKKNYAKQQASGKDVTPLDVKIGRDWWVFAITTIISLATFLIVSAYTYFAARQVVASENANDAARNAVRYSGRSLNRTLEKMEEQAGQTGRLADNAKTQADMTKELAATASGQLQVMQSDERGWLEFDLTPCSRQSQKEHYYFRVGQPLSVPVNVTNIGKIPVRDVQIKIFSDIFSATKRVPLNLVDDPASRSYAEITSGFVFPAKRMDFNATRTNNGQFMPTTVAEVSALQSGDSYLAIFGRITYKDAFNTRHTTNFCAWVPNESITYREYQTRSCVAFNNAD